MSVGEDPGLGPRKRGTIPKKDTLINVAGFHCIATYSSLSDISLGHLAFEKKVFPSKTAY